MFCGETGSVDILNSGRYFCEVAPGFGRYFNLVVDILIQENKVGKANNTLVVTCLGTLKHDSDITGTK